MKVVIPVGALHVGGGCRVLADIANAFVKSGHDTELVIPEGAPIEYKVQSKVTRVPSLSKEYIPYGDVVLPNFYTTFQSAFEAWPKQCVRLCQGFEPLWVPNPDYAMWTYAQDVPIVSVSHWLDEQIYSHLQKRSTVVNLGIDPAVFHQEGPKKQHRRKVILYLARDPNVGYELKGYHDFVACMQIFKHKYKGKFTVYMMCPERELPLPGIPHKVFGHQPDKEIAKLYRRADVFVSTSWIEGFGLPPLEAMACGTPVVTTNSGGVMDFCKHKRSAYVTAPRDVKRLAHGIKKVLVDKEFAEKITRGGLKSAGKLTHAKFVKEIVRAIETIFQNRV